ncbi:hypothetical protein [Streptomyces zaomyceticus]|uniref:hypothetical protein n=1 Tax=Streptomyces zaomyceticus TaxID=68286 RepID=UPI0037A913ED
MTTAVDHPPEHEERAARILVLRLVIRRGLTPQEASAAIDQVRRGEIDPHTHLATLEAAQLLASATAPVRAMLESLRPIAETAAHAMAELASVLATGNLGDRPAWVTPYGPPPRRRRRT